MRQETEFSTQLRYLRPPQNSAIWLVAIVGLSLSLAALVLIQQQLEAHKMLDFDWVAHNRIRAVSHGLDNNLIAIATLRDHIASSDSVDPTGFKMFAETLIERYPGIETLAWVAAEEDAPEGENPGGRYPVLHVVPERGEVIQTGFDLGTLSRFAETLARAGETGMLAVSGRIAYPGEKSNTEYGFMVASPVFSRQLGGGESAPVHARLKGFAVGFVKLGLLARAAISLLEPRGVEVLILDETAPPPERFLAFYGSRLSPGRVGETDYLAWLEDETESKVKERVPLVDREFTIVCGRTPLFRSAEAFQQSPWIVLVAGLLFTVLLSFYLARIRENLRVRLAMEDQLMEREELFRQMTETVDEAFWATDASGGKLLYLSPAFGTILGAKDDEPLATSLLSAAYAEDRPMLAAELERAGREGSDTEVVYRIERADGALRWVRTRGFAVRDPAGLVYRLVGFTEDITERKLADEALRDSEAKLRDLFQHAPDIIMTVDKKGKVLLMNRSIPSLPAERAIGRSSLALMPKEFRKWFMKALKKVFRKGVIRQFEYSADDGTYWEGRIVPITGEQGVVTAAIVIAADVTEKRNLEAQALSNARLASIGVLAAGVAHEINNPNNAIQFNATLISRAWHDIMPILEEYCEENGDFSLGGLNFSEARESFPGLISEIGRNSDRIRRIVQNLKHMSRQDTGTLTESVDIQQVLEATVMILHNQIQKFTDLCDVSIPDDLPPLQGNSQQLEQVFINILLNALQSLPDRSRGVFIRGGFDADNNLMWVSIRDEGRGISERDMGRLTEPFFTTRTDTGGTGLGLSISRSIVERHGGTMGFQSTRGSGTEVTVRLPLTHKELGG